MKYFSILEPWLEPQYKLIAQPPPGYDTGDTAQREGMFAFAALILNDLGKMDDEELFFVADRYAHVLALLNDPNHDGFLRRFPDARIWTGLSDRFSRDQAIPNVIAMAMHPDRLKAFFWRHLKYSLLLFMDNTKANAAPEDSAWKLPDLTFASFHGLYIRSFKFWPLYPFLWLSDWDLVVNSLIKVFYYGKDPTNNDDLNHVLCLYQAELTMPTLVSKLAKWIYKFRPFPANAGNADNPAQACMNAYFRGVNPGPKLEVIYQEINEHFK